MRAVPSFFEQNRSSTKTSGNNRPRVGEKIGICSFREFRSDAEAHIVFVEIKKPAGLKDAKRSAGILSKPSIGDIRSQVPFVFVVLHVVPNREGRRDIGAIEC